MYAQKHIDMRNSIHPSEKDAHWLQAHLACIIINIACMHYAIIMQTIMQATMCICYSRT